jgi:Spy/CpxP family protein refolding chaperone
VFVQFSLQLSDEQRKSVGDFEKEASRKLEELLSEEQRKQLKELQKNAGPSGPGSPGGPGGPPEIGRIMPGSIQDKLKLTTDQKDKLADLQKEADRKVDEILKEDQKKQLKGMADMMKTFARRPPGGRPGGPAGTGRGVFIGSGGGSAIFRAYRYGPSYPGLTGKDLTPTKTIEELESQQPSKKN